MGAYDDSDSVEQRVARIRGRMVWILSQLEGDGSALTDMADLKLGMAGGGPKGDELRAQQEAHERELEEALERQAKRLKAEHEAELAEARARLAAAQATEMQSLRAQLATAQEDVRAAKAAASKAERDARLESARSGGANEAEHRAELAEHTKRIAALEKAVREAGPLLAQAAAVLPPVHATGALASKLSTAQRTFELVLPGSAPKAPAAMINAAAAPTPVASSPMAKGLPPKPTAYDRAPAGAAPAVPPPAPPSSTPTSAASKWAAKAGGGAAAVAATPPPAAPKPAAPPQPSSAAADRARMPPPPPPANKQPGASAAANAAANAAAAVKATPPLPPKPAAGAMAAGAMAAGAKSLPSTPTLATPKPAGGVGTKQPPPREPKLTPGHFAYTHPGGSKPLGAKNQDTYFHLEIDAYNHVFGVLDGHGGENGTLVAEVASDAIKDYLADNFNKLRTSPEETFTIAFQKGHEAARQAVFDASQNRAEGGEFKLIQGLVVEEWEDEDGTMRREAVDGGTTATVIALVDGATLVHAQVGDSSALLGGTIMEEEGEEGGGEVTFEELMEEHSATNVKEYARRA